MTLRSASPVFADSFPASARRLRRALVLAALGAASAMPVWADTPAQAASAPAAAMPSTLTVKPGQSLNDLAAEVTQSHDAGVLARVSQALFEANPHAFMKHDPSLLMVGAALRVPADAASGAAPASASAATLAASTASAVQAASAPEVATASAATETLPASGAATASGAAEAGVMANHAPASAGASAAAPASASLSASDVAASATLAASAALAGAKGELDNATQAWRAQSDDVRTGVMAVAAAVLLLIVGLVWRSRRKARGKRKVEPFVTTPSSSPSSANPAPAAERDASPAAAAPVAEAAAADTAPEVPARSAAAQALARAMGKDESEAPAEQAAEAPVAAAPVAAEVPAIGGLAAAGVAAGTLAEPASEPAGRQEILSYKTTLTGTPHLLPGVIPASPDNAPAGDMPPVPVAEPAAPVPVAPAGVHGTLEAHVDGGSAETAPVQPIHTIPLDAIAALGSLDMGLPPRVSTGPIEPAAASTASAPVNGTDAETSHPASPGGLGGASFHALDLGFDLEHSTGAGGPVPAPSPEALARIARNKLDLAHEYVNIGDLAGARVLTQEVIDAGHPDTREAAQVLLARLQALS